jgi:Bacterial regulatory proteins, luxR family
MLTQGMSPHDTADALGCSEATVRTHMQRHFAKTRISGQPDPMRLATSALAPASRIGAVGVIQTDDEMGSADTYYLQPFAGGFQVWSRRRSQKGAAVHRGGEFGCWLGRHKRTSLD